MAILDPRDRWAIDQALPPALGRHSILPPDAALLLLVSALSACLAIGEDPLPSIPYFEQLMWAADYPNELIELGYFDDIFYLHDLTEQRTHADGARLGSLYCYSR
jgi:hypothetical protein